MSMVRSPSMLSWARSGAAKVISGKTSMLPPEAELFVKKGSILVLDLTSVGSGETLLDVDAFLGEGGAAVDNALGLGASLVLADLKHI